uniref:Uncharacterized protein n=1 Tax=Cucumis melo TaxID=3656 RepID=A0A9I9EM39_CUCME
MASKGPFTETADSCIDQPIEKNRPRQSSASYDHWGSCSGEFLNTSIRSTGSITQHVVNEEDRSPMFDSLFKIIYRSIFFEDTSPRTILSRK